MFAMLASGCSLQGAEGGAAAAAAGGLYPLDPSITDTKIIVFLNEYQRLGPIRESLDTFKQRLRASPPKEQVELLHLSMNNIIENDQDLTVTINHEILMRVLGKLDLQAKASAIDVKRLQEVVAVQQGQIATLTETVAQQQTQIQEQRAQIDVLMGLLGARLGQGPAQ